MLGKLMKYEWKATWKLLLSANLVTLVMAVLAWALENVVEYSSEYSIVDFMQTIVLFTFFFSVLAVSVGTVIYLIHRFYTSTYGDQGYLLHTLPVDTHHIIIAKVLVSTIWVLITEWIIIFSAVALLTGSMDTLRNMMEGFVEVLELLGAEKVTVFTGIMTMIAIVFSLLARVLKVTACISLGQLSSNHKLMVSFAWYIACYVVQRIIQTVYMAIVFAFYNSRSEVSLSSIFRSHWEIILLSSIIYSVVFYLLTWYVMSRKLNLD